MEFYWVNRYRLQEGEITFEDDIDDEPYVEEPFDESVLTPEQSLKVDELCKENPMLTRRDLADLHRTNIMLHRACLEGRELTWFEMRIAQDLKEVIYWVPPTELEGICDSNFELYDFENDRLPCAENDTSDLNAFVLIDECLDLICETQKLDDLRVEKLARNHFETCFDMNYLCVSYDFETDFLMLEESKSLLELHDLGDELDVDKILLEIENPQIEIDHENSNIVYYSVVGDNVDYYFKTSFEPVVDYIFPPHTFDSHDCLKIKDFMVLNVISFVKFLDEKSAYYLWAVVCPFAHFVSRVCRRRTKGALAQPFDSYD